MCWLPNTDQVLYLYSLKQSLQEQVRKLKQRGIRSLAQGHMVNKPELKQSRQPRHCNPQAPMSVLGAVTTAFWVALYWNFCVRNFLLGEFISAILVQTQFSLRKQSLTALAAISFVQTGREWAFSLNQGCSELHRGGRGHAVTCVCPQGLLGGLVSFGGEEGCRGWSRDGAWSQPPPPRREDKNVTKMTTKCTVQVQCPLWQSVF